MIEEELLTEATGDGKTLANLGQAESWREKVIQVTSGVSRG